MSQDTENVKRLINFKKRLETQIEKLHSRLKDTQATLDIVNSILLEKGFKRAEIQNQTTATEVPSQTEEPLPVTAPPAAILKPESVTLLKASSGEVLARLSIEENSLRVVPAEGKKFDVKTPPFTHFLVERVLSKMQERDGELVKTGQLEPDKIFSYNIVRDGDIIKEIVAKNIDQDRVKELRSSIRWTLDKMYEKMENSSEKAT